MGNAFIRKHAQKKLLPESLNSVTCGCCIRIRKQISRTLKPSELDQSAYHRMELLVYAVVKDIHTLPMHLACLELKKVFPMKLDNL